jgi:signal transduction histidine kinase
VRRDAPRHRLGLIGIEERATLLGGSVRIASHPGAGVTLIVDLPIHNGH